MRPSLEPGEWRCCGTPSGSKPRRSTNCRRDPRGASPRRDPAGQSRRCTVIRARIPIPTPLPHIPRHVIQPIPVRRKIPHRTRVRRNPVVERRMITPRRADVVGVARTAVIVGLAVRDRVHIRPRKPMPAGSAPRRLLPLRLRRQPIPAAPIHIRRHLRPPDTAPPTPHPCNTPASGPPSRSAHCTTSPQSYHVIVCAGWLLAFPDAPYSKL